MSNILTVRDILRAVQDVPSISVVDTYTDPYHSVGRAYLSLVDAIRDDTNRQREMGAIVYYDELAKKDIRDFTRVRDAINASPRATVGDVDGEA